jgi:chlorobactene glucosyltransferase
MNLPAFLLSQQQGVLVFLCLQLLVTGINWFGLRRLRSSPALVSEPFVSVLVPARNEAGQIERCVRSLLDQDYPSYELLVLDDQSSDGTASVLMGLAEKDSRLRVLSGQPLPEGWVGKNWACHQLSLEARGDWLLFTDADTWHNAGMLRHTLAYAQASRLDFLSGMPAQVTGSWMEGLAVPMLPWVAHAIIPIPLVRAWPAAAGTAAIGQFLLFSRRAYEVIGGHAAVPGSIVEDFALSWRAKRLGLRWDFVDASACVRTRMYTDGGQTWRGLSKGLYAAFGYNLPVFAFVWLWLLVVAWQPVAGLLLAVAGHPLPGFSLGLAAAAYSLDTVAWFVSDLRFRLPLWQAFLHPLTIAIYTAIGFQSAARHLLHRPVDWKGRSISTRR